MTTSPFPPLESANIIPATDSDPRYTVDGALYPTIQAINGHGDATLIEIVDPLAEVRAVAAIDRDGLDALIDTLQFLRNNRPAT